MPKFLRQGLATLLVGVLISATSAADGNASLTKTCSLKIHRGTAQSLKQCVHYLVSPRLWGLLRRCQVP